MPVIDIHGTYGSHHILRSTAKGLRIQIETSQKGVCHTLRNTAIISCAITIRDNRHIRCILLQTSYEVCPNDLRFHEGFGNIRIRLQIRDTAEAVEEHVVIIRTEDFEFSRILRIKVFGHIILIGCQCIQQFVTKHGTLNSGIPDILESVTKLIPSMGIEVFPITAIRPVLTRNSHRANTLIGSQRSDTPISPVVMKPLDIGIGLSYQQYDVVLFSQHIVRRRVTVVLLVKHMARNEEGSYHCA